MDHVLGDNDEIPDVPELFSLSQSDNLVALSPGTTEAVLNETTIGESHVGVGTHDFSVRFLSYRSHLLARFFMNFIFIIFFI